MSSRPHVEQRPNDATPHVGDRREATGPRPSSKAHEKGLDAVVSGVGCGDPAASGVDATRGAQGVELLVREPVPHSTTGVLEVEAGFLGEAGDVVAHDRARHTEQPTRTLDRRRVRITRFAAERVVDVEDGEVATGRTQHTTGEQVKQGDGVAAPADHHKGRRVTGKHPVTLSGRAGGRSDPLGPFAFTGVVGGLGHALRVPDRGVHAVR